MRISTFVTFEICDEIGKYVEVSRQSFEYDGPVAMAKSGKGAQKSNENFQQGQASNYSNNANSSYNAANNFFQNEMSTTPGQMSSSAAATYSNDLNNINNTYNSLRQNLFSTAGNRGYGNAPSGFTSSSLNSLNRSQGANQQSAYNQGQISTQQQGQQGAAGESGLYGTSTSGEVANTGAASNTANSLFNMGNSALSSILNTASSIIPGISGISNLINGSSSTGAQQTLGNLYGATQPDNASLQTTNSPITGTLQESIPGLQTFSPNSKKANSSVGNF